ncbi:unnamed protein product [Victoria cruziana]
MAQQQMSYLSPVRPSTPLSFVVCPLESHCLHRLKEKIFQSPGSASIIVHSQVCVLARWRASAISIGNHPILPPLENNGSQLKQRRK